MNNTNKPFQIYAVEIDLDERGPSKLVSFYTTQSDAKKAAKGASWYGGDGRVVAVNAIFVGDKTYLVGQEIDLDDQKAVKKETLKKQALAKLSQEEKDALFS